MTSKDSDWTAVLPAGVCDGIAGQQDLTTSKGGWALRWHLLNQLSEVLQKSGLEVVLLKGAALALQVYPEPWHRRMKDVDVLVRRGESEVARGALVGAGMVPMTKGLPRPRTGRLLGESIFIRKLGSLQMTVETHVQTDALVARPMDVAAVFARSRPAPGLAALRLPTLEDHVLMVALHAAAEGFAHPWGMVDLELLLAKGVDGNVLIGRAMEWRASTGLYLALRTLQGLGSTRVDEAWLQQLRPGVLRSAVLKPVFEDADAPRARWKKPRGWRFIAAQAALRDDVANFGAGMARYVMLRTVERVERRLRGAP